MTLRGSHQSSALQLLAGLEATTTTLRTCGQYRARFTSPSWLICRIARVARHLSTYTADATTRAGARRQQLLVCRAQRPMGPKHSSVHPACAVHPPSLPHLLHNVDAAGGAAKAAHLAPLLIVPPAGDNAAGRTEVQRQAAGRRMQESDVKGGQQQGIARRPAENHPMPLQPHAPRMQHHAVATVQTTATTRHSPETIARPPHPAHRPSVSVSSSGSCTSARMR